MPTERLKKILLNIFLHPASLALPVALGVIWLVPDVFDKYSITPIAEKIISEGINIEHYDLNHDGITEWYYAGPGAKGKSSIVLRNHGEVVFDWGIDGLFASNNRTKCIVGDYNNDSIDEIYTFTVRNDSLLANCINFQIKGKPEFANMFITVIKGDNPLTDFAFSTGKVTDLNGDGYKEIVFAVSTGYGLSPRKVFSLDVKNQKVWSSPELGGHIGSLDFADIDNDGEDEITVSNYGPGNIKDTSLPMQDTCAYVIVLDNNLQLMFTPIPLTGRYSNIQNRFIRTKNGYRLASLWNPNSQLPNVTSLKLFDLNGHLLKMTNFPTEEREKQIYYMYGIHSANKEDKILVVVSGETVNTYSAELNVLTTSDLKPSEGQALMYDLDQDGEKELIFQSLIPERWIIERNNLSYPVVFKTHASLTVPLLYTLLNNNEKPRFCFQLDNRQYILEYGFNPMYYWQYPVYFGIYLSILGFILLIQRISKIQLQKKYETEKRIAELQYVSLQNQISPHFTFNVLNTIGSAINQEKKDEAYQMLLKFSKLLRTLLTNPETVTRTLQEELEFVTNFLEIQKHRFKDVFTYKIDLDQRVDLNQLIPKSCLQTYVENALKHGIAPLKHSGEIKIEIIKQEKNLEIKVTDNGVGRANSSRTSSQSTGRGLKIMHQYYELFNKANKENITEEFIDLTDSEGNPTGTEVIIRIPDDFQFSLSSVSNK